jgi:4,5-DOPA dioxygenase extradiol
MGLDHGAWTVLKYLYPKADIPVFQLSIDYSESPNYHYELAKQLKSLRKKGVLIIGSGNIVHNLNLLDWSSQEAKPHDWVVEFDLNVKNKLDNLQFSDLINYQNMGKSALLSIPTNEHYLPMLYVLGLLEKGEKVTHLYEAYEFGSLSMRSFKIS